MYAITRANGDYLTPNAKWTSQLAFAALFHTEEGVKAGLVQLSGSGRPTRLAYAIRRRLTATFRTTNGNFVGDITRAELFPDYQAASPHLDSSSDLFLVALGHVHLLRLGRNCLDLSPGTD